MKKIVLIVLALIAMIAVVILTKGKSPTTNSTEGDTTTETTQEVTVVNGEGVEKVVFELREDEKAIITLLAKDSSGVNLLMKETETKFVHLNDGLRKVINMYLSMNTRKDFREVGPHLNALYDQLSAVNQDPFPIALDVNSGEGFFLDTAKLYDKHYKGEGKEWESLKKEIPNIGAVVSVSRAAFNEDAKVGVIHLSKLTGVRDGSGKLVFYRYDKKRLRVLAEYSTWVSHTK